MAMVIDPQTGVPSLTAPLSDAEKLALTGAVQNVVKPEGWNGVTLDMLRPQYPGVGWVEMKLRLSQLVDDGVLRVKMFKPRGAKVAYETWEVV